MAVDPLTAGVSLLGNFLLGLGSDTQQQRQSFGAPRVTGLSGDVEGLIKGLLGESIAQQGAPIEFPGRPIPAFAQEQTRIAGAPFPIGLNIGETAGQAQTFAAPTPAGPDLSQFLGRRGRQTGVPGPEASSQRAGMPDPVSGGQITFTDPNFTGDPRNPGGGGTGQPFDVDFDQRGRFAQGPVPGFDFDPNQIGGIPDPPRTSVTGGFAPISPEDLLRGGTPEEVQEAQSLIQQVLEGLGISI